MKQKILNAYINREKSKICDESELNLEIITNCTKESLNKLINEIKT